VRNIDECDCVTLLFGNDQDQKIGDKFEERPLYSGLRFSKMITQLFAMEGPRVGNTRCRASYLPWRDLATPIRGIFQLFAMEGPRVSYTR